MRRTHTEKANLEEKCPLLAQVRKKATQLLPDTLGVFRVWCFLAMLFVSLPHDPIGGAVDLTTQRPWWSNWWRRAQALSVSAASMAATGGSWQLLEASG